MERDNLTSKPLSANPKNAYKRPKSPLAMPPMTPPESPTNEEHEEEEEDDKVNQEEPDGSFESESKRNGKQRVVNIQDDDLGRNTTSEDSTQQSSEPVLSEDQLRSPSAWKLREGELPPLPFYVMGDDLTAVIKRGSSEPKKSRHRLHTAACTESKMKQTFDQANFVKDPAVASKNERSAQAKSSANYRPSKPSTILRDSRIDFDTRWGGSRLKTVSDDLEKYKSSIPREVEFKIRQLADDHSQIQKSVRELQRQLEVYNIKLEATKIELQATQQQVDQLEDELVTKEDALEHETEEKDALNHATKEKDEFIRNLLSDLRESQNAHIVLQDVDMHTKGFHDLNKELHHLHKEIQESRTKNDQLTAENEQLQEKIHRQSLESSDKLTKAKEELQESRAKNDQLTAENEDLREKLQRQRQESSDELAKVKEHLQTAQSSKSLDEAAVQKATSDAKKLEQELVKVLVRNASLREYNATISQQAGQNKRALDTAKEELSKLKNSKRYTRNQLEYLAGASKVKIAEMEKELEKCRRILREQINEETRTRWEYDAFRGRSRARSPLPCSPDEIWLGRPRSPERAIQLKRNRLARHREIENEIYVAKAKIREQELEFAEKTGWKCPGQVMSAGRMSSEARPFPSFDGEAYMWKHLPHEDE
ncbi:MAG: hypothetical protein M1822_003909 [Bathelium mastoideum]|nr:MAG: hypothetical protein M1822_003909 [Bathelium mastoideum]